MRRFLSLFLFLFVFFLPGARNAEPGELRIGLPRLPVVLDPATAQDDADRFIYPQIFETLVRFRDGGTDIEPGLATSWQVSRDGLTWTFRLRPNVRFHDGTTLFADHVVLALERQMVPDHPLHPNPPALWTKALSGTPGIVRGVARKDPTTVSIELAQPFGPLLAMLAHPALAIVLPASGGATGTTPFVGTGPFRVAQMDAGVMTLEAHLDYWGGTPHVDRVIVREITDEAVALGDLLGGGLDVLVAVNLPSSGPAGSAPVRLLSAPTGSLGVLLLNTNREPVKRKKVRQALALALDPQLITPALKRTADFARNFLPPGFWGAADGSFYPPMNPARARALLAEERIKEGTILTLLVEKSSGGPDLAAVAQALQSAWAFLGLKLTVRIESPEEFRTTIKSGEYELALTEQKVPVLDPDSLFAPLASLSGVADQRLVDLLFRAGQLSNRTERLRLYQRAQTLLTEGFLWFPLFHPLQWAFVRPEVRAFSLHPSGTVRLDAVRLEP